MKEIIVDNKDKFYKKLHFYKSFWYKNTTFRTDIKDDELLSIIEALNIKNKSERVEYIYNDTCRRIEEYYKDKNICEFQNGQCILHREFECDIQNGCCHICIYQSNKGCTSSNISCKMYYCDWIKNKRTDVKFLKFDDIKIFKLLTFRQKLMILDGFFSKKEDFLKELKVGSYIFHSARFTNRFIKNQIKLHKNHKDKMTKIK